MKSIYVDDLHKLMTVNFFPIEMFGRSTWSKGNMREQSSTLT